MKTILFASSGYGDLILKALLANAADVQLIVGKHDGEGVDTLAAAAAAAGITYADVDPDSNDAVFERIRSCEPDVVVSVIGARKVSAHVARLAKKTVHLHPSLLPVYRGPSPSNWSLINGDGTTGVSLVEHARQPDSGAVLLRREVAIEASDDDGTLRARLGAEMGILIGGYLDRLRSGETLIAMPQDDRRITFFPAIGPRDGHVRFDQSVDKVLARVRGVSPSPGAYTDWGPHELRFARAWGSGEEARYDRVPGSVLALLPTGDRLQMTIAALDGAVHFDLIANAAEATALRSTFEAEPLLAGVHTPFSAERIEAGAEYDTDRPSDEEFDRYLKFPDMVVLAVAYPCNAFCPNCPYTPGNSEIRLKYGDAQFIKPELFFKIADECGEAGRRGLLPGNVGSMIRITGGGEPMLHPYGMTKLIEYAKNAGARVYLNSNGSMIQDDDIDRLLACDTDNIEISVDAGDAETYAVVRKGLDWDRVVGTIQTLVERRNATRSATTIEVSVINQEIVAGKIESIERFWYGLGVDNVIVRKFLTWGSATGLDPNASADPMAYLDRDEGVPCPYPFHRLNIDTRGKVEVCGFDIAGRTNFGNVFESSIEDIWKGSMFAWFRQLHQAGRGGDIPLCAECPDWKYRSWQHNYRKALAVAAERRDAALAKA